MRQMPGLLDMSVWYCSTFLFSLDKLVMPSVLWRCWLGGRKSIRPVKIESWVCFCLPATSYWIGEKDHHYSYVTSRYMYKLLLHPFNGLFSSTIEISRHQRNKNSLYLKEARDDEVLGCSGISWTICKQSAPRSRQITTATPQNSIFTGRMLFLTPNQQCRSTKGNFTLGTKTLYYNVPYITERTHYTTTQV